MKNEALLPAGWPRPKGYANGVAATGRQLYVAGQIGWSPEGVFASDDFAEQARTALAPTSPPCCAPAVRSPSTSCA